MVDFSPGYEVGQVVELPDGRIATVRYVGSTSFSAGEWIGLELQEATGKNNGTVQGEQYFDCAPAHGMFVRPSAATVIEQAPSKMNGKAKDGNLNGRSQRPVSGVTKRQSVAPTAGRRQSVQPASPSPASRPVPASRLSRSPVKSPVKQVGSAASSASSTARTSAPPVTNRSRPSMSNRQSTSQSSTSSTAPRNSRQSLVGPMNRGRSSNPVTPSAVKTPGNRLSLKPSQKAEPKRPQADASDSNHQIMEESENGTQDEEAPSAVSGSPAQSPSKVESPVLSRSSAASGNLVSRAAPSRGNSSSSATPRAPAASTVTSREVEDLKTKLRMMEKKRMEDRDKLKSLERVQAERDKFESIIGKLQAKYQPQQQEIVELKKQLKDAEARVEEVETHQAEHEVVVEMATLDREMAEETAEAVKTELEALKQKQEELELEVEVLREENEELGQEMSPEEKTSQGWLQMERNNERLRDALLRLREMTQQQEAELKDQVKSLEDDVQDMSGIKQQYELTNEKLLQSEADIEDLRQQLEIALGAEDMIEELTERNMNMSEQMEELRATIEDLESLKELNDELEYNHVENEKQMQVELDYKDVLLSENARRSAQYEETIEDSEYTISRFRDLVTNMQSDLEDMRASQQITETEAEELTSRSRAMMDLNMKLQVSASKTQVKTIDLELRRLEAQEAAEHLAIVQLFLPDSFNSDRDSVLALLRFKRVEFKAQLMHGFVKDRINGQSSSGHEDDVFAACDVLDKLTWVSAMCDRFVNSIGGCSIEQFEKFEGALYELEPVERALNGWIDGLKRDEFKETQCASELQRTMALMSHLAEVHISESFESYADDVTMRVLLMQSHLESTATAILHVKGMTQAKVSSVDEDGELIEHFAKQADALISHSRSAKVVAGKTVRSLEELKARSLSLTLDTSSAFERCQTSAQELAHYSRKIGEDLCELFSVEGRSDRYTYEEIQSTVQRTTNAIFNITQVDVFETFGNKLRTLSNNLADLGSMTSDLELTIEFERPPAPWVLRSQEIKSRKLISVDAEEEIRKLRDDVHERVMQLRIRDKSLEESAVKIELLEARTRDASKKADRINELERFVDTAKVRENELTEAIEVQKREIKSLGIDCQRWKEAANERQAFEPRSSDGNHPLAEKTTVATARETEALQREISTLQSTVRYLHEDNQKARLPDVSSSSSLAWLREPLVKPKTPQEESANRIKSEGQDVFHEMLNLVSDAKVVDLRSRGLQENKLGWRKRSETPAWQLMSQKEDWERWRQWRNEVVAKGRNVSRGEAPGTRKPVPRSAAPTIDFGSVGLGGEKFEGNEPLREVQIVDPEALQAT